MRSARNSKMWMLPYAMVIIYTQGGYLIYYLCVKGDLRVSGNVYLIASVIGVLGALGALIVAIYQNTKEVKKIDKIKGHTEKICPKVETTDGTATEIRKYISDDIRPDVSSTKELANSISSDLQIVVDDVKHRQWISKEKAGKIEVSDIYTGVDELVKDNARLTQNLMDAEALNNEYQIEIHELQQKIERLNAQNMEMKKEISRMNQKDRPRYRNRDEEFEI